MDTENNCKTKSSMCFIRDVFPSKVYILLLVYLSNIVIIYMSYICVIYILINCIMVINHND